MFEQNPRPFGKIEDGLPRWHHKLREKEYSAIGAKLSHPNIFYVPKTDWQRVGGDPDLIGFVAWFYSNLFPDIWEEFSAVAGTPSLRPDAKSDSTAGGGGPAPAGRDAQ